ncbi:MAG: sulfite exporter TauE/SafE family protein [Robiginitomaculum sp.]|nr:sulfite exporter TauE/SafE family protein [Robiginitomaculum sp.]
MDTQLFILAFALLAVGGVAGFSAGLFGIGGGAIIVPALYYTFSALGYSQDISMHVAIATSMAVIIVSSLRSAHSHHHRGAVDWSLVWPKNPLRSWGIWIGVGSLIAALIISPHLSGASLVSIFAVFIAGIGLQFIFGRPEWTLLNHVPRDGIVPPIFGSILGGFCALLGIGFGSIGVTLMVLCKKKIHEAIGTAAALGFFISLPATIGYILSGQNISGRPDYSIGYVNVLGFVMIAITSFIFAPLGVKTAHNLSQQKLRIVFGICLLGLALNMIRKGLLV